MVLPVRGEQQAGAELADHLDQPDPVLQRAGHCAVRELQVDALVQAQDRRGGGGLPVAFGRGAARARLAPGEVAHPDRGAARLGAQQQPGAGQLGVIGVRADRQHVQWHRGGSYAAGRWTASRATICGILPAHVANMQRIVVAALSLLGIAALVIAQPVGPE